MDADWLVDEGQIFGRHGALGTPTRGARAWPEPPLPPIEGRLLRERARELCTLFDVKVRPQQMTARKLELGFRNLAPRVYRRSDASVGSVSCYVAMSC